MYAFLMTYPCDGKPGTGYCEDSITWKRVFEVSKAKFVKDNEFVILTLEITHCSNYLKLQV